MLAVLSRCCGNTGCWQCCHAAVEILGAGSAVTLLWEYWVLAVLSRCCGNTGCWQCCHAACGNTGCWQCCHAAVGILGAGSAVTRPVGILGAGSAVTLLLEYWVLAVLLRYCGNSLLCAGSAVTL